MEGEALDDRPRRRTVKLLGLHDPAHQLEAVEVVVCRPESHMWMMRHLETRLGGERTGRPMWDTCRWFGRRELNESPSRLPPSRLTSQQRHPHPTRISSPPSSTHLSRAYTPLDVDRRWLRAAKEVSSAGFHDVLPPCWPARGDGPQLTRGFVARLTVCQTRAARLSRRRTRR